MLHQIKEPQFYKYFLKLIFYVKQSNISKVVYYRNEILFFGFYRCVNSGESLTNWIKPGGLYVEFVSDSPEFTHR